MINTANTISILSHLLSQLAYHGSYHSCHIYHNYRLTAALSTTAIPLAEIPRTEIYPVKSLMDFILGGSLNSRNEFCVSCHCMISAPPGVVPADTS